MYRRALRGLIGFLALAAVLTVVRAQLPSGIDPEAINDSQYHTIKRVASK